MSVVLEKMKPLDRVHFSLAGPDGQSVGHANHERRGDQTDPEQPSFTHAPDDRRDGQPDQGCQAGTEERGERRRKRGANRRADLTDKRRPDDHGGRCDQGDEQAHAITDPWAHPIPTEIHAV